MSTTAHSSSSYTPPSPMTATSGERAIFPAFDDPVAFVTAALKAGVEADLDNWTGLKPSTNDAAAWTRNRTLTADFIIQLCTETSTPTNPYPRGIRITGARIVGALDLSSSTIGGLLVLERCRIESNISLRDSTTRLLNFAGSRVRGFIDGDRLRCTGGVYLRDGFVCEKFVRLSAATISGDVDCRDGTIEGAIEKPEQHGPKLALRCDRAAISGSVFFRRFCAMGEVRLLDANVGVNVVCDDATFANTNGDALQADNVRIGGSLMFGEWKTRPTSLVSVRNATAHALHLGKPEHTALGKEMIRAQGFRYDTIAGDGAVNLGLSTRWLDALVTVPFNPQPYEQCAKVLREIGHANQAKEVAILRRQVERRLPGITRWKKFRSWLLDALIGYGYRPGRSIVMLIVLTTIGAGVFQWAAATNAMVPTDATAAASYVTGQALPNGYPEFSAPVYAADVLLPIIDFQQESKWRPNQTRKPGDDSLITTGTIAVWTMRLLIAAGWVRSTLLVASVTGLIRKD